MTEEEKNIQDAAIEESEKEIEELTIEEKKEKKIKNLISLAILLAGLFIGSLFVDIVQLIEGSGFSQKALDSTDVFAVNGKTWVAFQDPIIKLQIVNDESCGNLCRPDEVLVGLKQTLPTLVTEKIDVNSEAGKKLINTFSLKTVPAFIFSKDIEKTTLFEKAEPFFNKQTEGYAIKSSEAGFPVGKYIARPSVSDKDIKIGSDDAKVKVVVVTDISSQTDAKAYTSIVEPMIKDYTENVQIIFKNYSPMASPLSSSVGLASYCANEQGKFQQYANKVISSQSSLMKLKDPITTLKGYASQVGVKIEDFNKCLDDKKYTEQINSVKEEIKSFGIQATPAIFIGSNIQKPNATYDDIKKTIDEEIGK